MSQKLELLAPAGSPEALDAAVGEGADAVYLGLKDFNARLRATNFTYGQFESALRSLRRMKKKVYVTVNTVFEQREADRMYQLLKYLSSVGPDAIIVQDFGVIEMARSQFPSLRLHASTQMNIASANGANALSRHGVSRAVLARELSLDELRCIKQETNLELEVFVHGALCVSVSGLCLFSSYLGGKSANRGMCAQACRRLYSKQSSHNSREDSERENGYYFSPNDLQLLECVPDLAAAGITALKIEGRMKSASYVGTVVSAYRLVADAVAGGDKDEIRLSIEKGLEILRNDFARAKTKYYIYSHSPRSPIGLPAAQRINSAIEWLNPSQDGGTGIPLGAITKTKGSGKERKALVLPHTHLRSETGVSARDTVRIHRSNDSGRVTHKLTFAEKEGNGFWISAPEGSAGDSVYLIQAKESRKRYAPVIAGNAGSKGPGRDKAPDQITGSIKQKIHGQAARSDFPEGLYVAVSRPEDLFIVQSSRPQRVILPFTQKNVKYLLTGSNSPLPFKKTEIILSFDPWFPQNSIDVEPIEYLIEEGYSNYIVNNLGHFSLFKNHRNVKLIAGPWLYAFNSWALSFIMSFGADGFITPLENNRQNLERTLNKRKKQEAGLLHSKCFVTVFAYPPLFRIKADLSALNVKSFSDNMGENFSLVTDLDGSRVYPQNYFSIIDKIPFLKEAGLKRFVADLSGTALKKNNYRDLMRAIREGSPLPHSNRFNWKNGFYTSI